MVETRFVMTGAIFLLLFTLLALAAVVYYCVKLTTWREQEAFRSASSALLPLISGTVTNRGQLLGTYAGKSVTVTGGHIGKGSLHVLNTRMLAGRGQADWSLRYGGNAWRFEIKDGGLKTRLTEAGALDAAARWSDHGTTISYNAKDGVLSATTPFLSRYPDAAAFQIQLDALVALAQCNTHTNAGRWAI